jgi:hypothetical protein
VDILKLPLMISEYQTENRFRLHDPVLLAPAIKVMSTNLAINKIGDFVHFDAARKACSPVLGGNDLGSLHAHPSSGSGDKSPKRSSAFKSAYFLGLISRPSPKQTSGPVEPAAAEKIFTRQNGMNVEILETSSK